MSFSYKYFSRSMCGFYAVCLFLLITASGCKKYLELPLPVNQIAGAAAFANNGSASATLSNIYAQLDGSLFQGSGGMPYNAGLYTDEQINAAVSGNNQAFYTDGVSGTTAGTYWSSLFKILYATNLAIEGISPTQLTMKSQLLGEAYFLRAFIHFYLTNLYGTTPIVTVSDYITNNQLARSPQADVYKQIVVDLRQAQNLLSGDYMDLKGFVTTDRSRPNRMAASALLARVYLYTRDWAGAESQADSLIGAAATYQLTPPAQTFLAGSEETIWGLAPLGNANVVTDAAAYIITPGTTPLASNVGSYLSPALLNVFEPGDSRFSNWVGVSNVAASGNQPAATYYFSYKYKTKGSVTTPVEYLSMLRLGETYLIRAEARAQLGEITGAGSAAEDLNAVRARAGLAATTAATQDDMLAAILHERQVELFAEGGHRLLDLRRTGNLDAVMKVIAPTKNATWNSLFEWWPIPTIDLTTNPNLTQTPGY